jgi:hypothetical protein
LILSFVPLASGPGVPHLISKANDEEKNVEKLGSDSKFIRKSIIFTRRINETLSSVNLLAKEPSSLRVCSRSSIAGDDLTFEIKFVIGATQNAPNTTWTVMYRTVHVVWFIMIFTMVLHLFITSEIN